MGVGGRANVSGAELESTATCGDGLPEPEGVGGVSPSLETWTSKSGDWRGVDGEEADDDEVA